MLLFIFLISSNIVDTTSIYELKYKLSVSDKYNNIVNDGYVELTIAQDTSMTFSRIIEYKIYLRGGQPSKIIVEKAITYPNISIFFLDNALKQRLLEKRWYNNSVCTYYYIDELPYSFPNGQIVKALLVECSATRGGFIYLKYDEKTGILLEKILSILVGNEAYYLQLQLITPIEGMNFLSLSNKSIVIIQTTAIVVVILSIIAFSLREKYRII